MRKTIFLLGIIGILSSCKKDCKKDNTAIIRFTNNEQVDATVRLPGGQFTDETELDVLAGETTSIIVNTRVSIGGVNRWENGWKGSYDVNWADGTKTGVVINVLECDVDEILLQK